MPEQVERIEGDWLEILRIAGVPPSTQVVLDWYGATSVTFGMPDVTLQDLYEIRSLVVKVVERKRPALPLRPIGVAHGRKGAEDGLLLAGRDYYPAVGVYDLGTAGVAPARLRPPVLDADSEAIDGFGGVLVAGRLDLSVAAGHRARVVISHEPRLRRASGSFYSE
jgi:hypothetical protein